MGGSGASSTLTGTRLSAPVNGGPRYDHQTSPPGRLLAPGGVCPDPEPTCNIAFNTFYSTRHWSHVGKFFVLFSLALDRKIQQERWIVKD